MVEPAAGLDRKQNDGMGSGCGHYMMCPIKVLLVSGKFKDFEAF